MDELKQPGIDAGTSLDKVVTMQSVSLLIKSYPDHKKRGQSPLYTKQ
jgi:hypothetical protein